MAETQTGQMLEAAGPATRPRIPASTYRLQFNPSFTFADAERLLPYLDRLGVTDVYSSPYLKAKPGSMHGYDISDHNRLNPDLGGEDAYAGFARALASHRMGQVLDFVPNHMGLDDARANVWWWDVLENGPCSPYAQFFDVDWDPVKPELKNKVLLPILGDQYGRVLERGEFHVGFHDGALVLRYWERELPINPRRTPMVLRHGLQALETELGGSDPDLRELLSILTELDNLPSTRETDPERIAERQREKEVARERLKRLVERSERIRKHVEDCVRAVHGRPGQPSSFDLLHRLLEVQIYRLAYWRTAFHEINYRRFFDVNGLGALRMEDSQVFEAAHALVLRLMREGSVTGIRLDHLDGLFHPHRYLQRLRHAIAEALGVAVSDAADRTKPPLSAYLVAEKIVSPGESLPSSWPLHGTSGYEFLNQVNGLFVEPKNHKSMLKLYERFTGKRAALDEVVYESKKVVMETTLASELNMLAHALNRISERDRRSRDYTLNSLHDMLLEVVACFPVYRTYVADGIYAEEDARLLEAAVGRARRRNPAMDASIFEFFHDVMLDHVSQDLSEADRIQRREFAMKLQQYTGPVQAKGLEDTAFYRYNVLVSLNEVGGAPQRFGRAPAEFHAANRTRLERWPYSMICTSTHDTKRGEDARARVNVLSELADDWSRAVSKWTKINAVNRTQVDEDFAPDRNDEYLFYQMLIAAWPPAAVDSTELVARLRAYMMKAIHEAKVHTSWINENRAYDRAVAQFVEKTLTGNRADKFLEAFVPFHRKVARLAMVNSLAQLVLKLASPGVPDFYQGSELWDLSLVDPDNRGPVDFERRAVMLDGLGPLLNDPTPAAERAELLADLVEHWEDGRIKLYLTARGLRLRRERKDLFLDGDYVPLAADRDREEHVVAFARVRGDAVVIAVAPRLVARLAGGEIPLGSEAWGNSRLILPRPLAARTYRSVLTGEEIGAIERHESVGLPLAEALKVCPVALLVGVG